MSKFYKGFITHEQYFELRDLLDKIADTRGLENKLHHLYQPDTDMNDKICENLEHSKVFITRDLKTMKYNIDELITKVFKL